MYFGILMPHAAIYTYSLVASVVLVWVEVNKCIDDVTHTSNDIPGVASSLSFTKDSADYTGSVTQLYNPYISNM